MKIAIIIGIIWILGIIFYLSLFKAASRGDKILEDVTEIKDENEDDIV